MSTGARVAALLSLSPPSDPHFKDYPKVEEGPAGGLTAAFRGPRGALHSHKQCRGFNNGSSSHH